jgi:ComF family protein
MNKLPLFAHPQKLLTVCADFVFPPTDHEKMLRTIEPKTLRQLYQPGRFEKTVYLASYQDPLVQALIIENKFYHHRKAAAYLGELLARWVAEEKSNPLFIPIPLGKKRLRERGHNQVTSILKAATPAVNIEERLLKRAVDTKPQTELTESERLKNVKNAFVFAGKPEKLANYAQIVLVDDVVTTGSTLKAAEAVLRPQLSAGTKLTALALAH